MIVLGTRGQASRLAPSLVGAQGLQGYEGHLRRNALVVTSAFDAPTTLEFRSDLGAYPATLFGGVGFSSVPAASDPLSTDPAVAFPPIAPHTVGTHNWPMLYRGLKVDATYSPCDCGSCGTFGQLLIAVIMHDLGGRNVGTSIFVEPTREPAPLIIPATAWYLGGSTFGPTYAALRAALNAGALADVLAPVVIARYRGDRHNLRLFAEIIP